MRIIVSNSTCRNFDNLNEMEKFLQSHNPSEITQNKIHNLNCYSSLNKFILYLETFWKGKKKKTPQAKMVPLANCVKYLKKK